MKKVEKTTDTKNKKSVSYLKKTPSERALKRLKTYRLYLKENEPMNILEIDAIILLQSCDIENDKIDSIIICPIWPLKRLIESNPYYESSRAREELRQGKSPSFHLLNKITLSGKIEDFYFVDFRNIYSLPKSFALSLSKRGKRKRLLPPYREHLSQSFARYFMRVGLPTDIPSDEIKKYPIA